MTSNPNPNGEALRRAVEDLREIVRRGNVRWARLTLLEGLGLAIAAPLACLWLIFLTDTVLHLSRFGRFAAMTVFCAVVLGLFWRLARNWRKARFSEDQVALAMERRTPGGIQNRLINAIQLSRTNGVETDEAGQAVILENYRHLQAVRLEQAARSKPAMIRLTLAAALVAAGVIFWAFSRERFTTAAARIFMPFAEVAPVYRTVLDVLPGDMEVAPGTDVELKVTIKGQVPAKLAVLSNTEGKRSSIEITLSPKNRSVKHTFPAVKNSFTYAVRGGDYVSPSFRINVLHPCELKTLRAVYSMPEYTGLPERVQEGTSGDLEALYGTTAKLHFTFTQPPEQAVLLPERPDPAMGDEPERIILKQVAPAEFACELTLTNITAYCLETTQHERAPSPSRRYSVVLTDDQPPALQLAGLNRRQEVFAEAILPLSIAARDDFGLLNVQLVFRPIDAALAGDLPEAQTANWQTLHSWDVTEHAPVFATNLPLPVAAMEAAEGESIELALLALDTDPLKADLPTLGGRCRLDVAGIGSALQLLYERILRSESNMLALAQTLDTEIAAATSWGRRLDPSAGTRWDDARNLRELEEGMAKLARGQAALRSAIAEAARAMPEQAATVKLSLGMLADTEVVRIIRMLEMAPRRETPQEMRAMLAEARLTQQRVGKSLNDLLGKYREFRVEWELTHIIPFVKMLADRQEKMETESLTYAGLPAGAADSRLCRGAGRRQSKVLELSILAQNAMAGLGHAAPLAGQAMAEGFTQAAAAFDSAEVKPLMRKATAALETGTWLAAATEQKQAAAALARIHQELVDIQVEMARQALAELQKLAETSLDAQAELAKLKAGSAESLLNFDPNKAILSEILQLQEKVAELKKRHELNQNDSPAPGYKFEDSLRAGLGAAAAPTNTDFSILTLADKPGGQRTFPESSDLQGNPVDVKLLDAVFEDLVGDLLEEADDLRDEFETYNINKTGQGLEPGDIGKQAGDMNSVSAAAATGNQKPPTHDFGGASRSGRMGARAHGLVVGEESVNRRGRDEAQDSQEQIPDQLGLIQSIASSDPQKDTATGMGGKDVKADQTSFSTKDSGEWKDEYADRMKAPQDTYQIVERKGKALSPKIAEKLRDLESRQEQIIERIKTIKKELDQLYLPSEHLDDIMEQLKANLDRLKDKPDEDVFRLQRETLERLAGAVIVFSRPSSEFQPSLPRDQSVRGRVLAEPAGPVLPGYEEAVKRYYERLAR